MTTNLELTVRHDEPDEAWWVVASVAEVPGPPSQGRASDEARADVVEALRLMPTSDGDVPVGATRAYRAGSSDVAACGRAGELGDGA